MSVQNKRGLWRTQLMRSMLYITIAVSESLDLLIRDPFCCPDSCWRALTDVVPNASDEATGKCALCSPLATALFEHSDSRARRTVTITLRGP